MASDDAKNPPPKISRMQLVLKRTAAALTAIGENLGKREREKEKETSKEYSSNP